MDAFSDTCCWLCFMPASFCYCEVSDPSWSRSTSRQSSGLTHEGHDGHKKMVDLDADETTVLGFTFEDPSLELDDRTQPLDRWSHLSGTMTHDTPNIDNAAQWESPGAVPPPDSSSPLGISGADSSPSWTSAAPPSLPLPCQENIVFTDTGPFYPPCNNNGGAWSNTLIFPTSVSTTRALSPLPLLPLEFHTRANKNASSQTTLGGGCSIHCPVGVAQSSSLAPIVVGDPIQGSLDQGYPATHDICTIPTASENLNLLGKPDGIDRIQTKFDVHEGNAFLPFITSGNRRLKRRRSSPSISPKPKKLKLERTTSRTLCAGDTSGPIYQATEPASLRRAQSLRSEISACSELESASDSLFYPSPLSEPNPKPPVEEYAPTVPNTPLPDSVDYARSKANPMVRTIPVYRQRSLNIPMMPPVPIIAPPQGIGPVYIHCPEDQAIDRLKALLHRERSERDTGGLNVQDCMRADRLKGKYPIELAFARRDSASTTDTSSRWEEESTWCSQGSQPSVHSVRALPLQGQCRFADREAWSGTFGIESDLRKEIIEWILKKIPRKSKSFEEPAQDRYQLGSDLYDQLTNSPQTRFHAAQLFLRYLRVPEKAEFWRDACEHDCRERDRSIWDLAVACIALGVKLHRDCLPPLSPVFSVEFLELASHPVTHAELECAQRDVMYTLQCLLGSCTPQDVLDELWNALPTLRKATAPITNGWTVVQRFVWVKLFESLFEPDMLQYPVTLLTGAALVDGLVFSLALHFKVEGLGEGKGTQPNPTIPECIPDDIEAVTWQICCFEAEQLVENVILDIRDVLELSEGELDECRIWLSHAGEK